jgi:hypothetical protein
MAWAAWAATLGAWFATDTGTPDDTRICFEIFETAVDDLGRRTGGNANATAGDPAAFDIRRPLFDHLAATGELWWIAEDESTGDPSATRARPAGRRPRADRVLRAPGCPVERDRARGSLSVPSRPRRAPPRDRGDDRYPGDRALLKTGSMPPAMIGWRRAARRAACE